MGCQGINNDIIKGYFIIKCKKSKGYFWEFRNQVLNPLMKDDLIEMTIPDKPRSSKQKYCLTEKGKQVLDAIQGNDVCRRFAFKNIKSFVKIRPFFVNKNEHGKAVYTICVLSYFINRYLSQKRKASETKDFLNSKQLYEPFNSCKLETFLDALSGIIEKDIIPLSEKQKEILQGIASERVLKFTPNYSSIK